MSSFDDRKDAFENKYAHDQELTFKVEARTSKLFGLWAADQLGLSGEEAEKYAKDVVAAKLSAPGFEGVKGKVSTDFTARDVDISDHLLDTHLQKCMEEARNQIMAANA